MFATFNSMARRPAINKEGMLDRPCGTISITLFVAILPILLAQSKPAAATLGGDEASVAADQVHMKATRRTVNSQEYKTHEIQMTSGKHPTLREHRPHLYLELVYPLPREKIGLHVRWGMC
jgi:hypothetical protein